MFVVPASEFNNTIFIIIYTYLLLAHQMVHPTCHQRTALSLLFAECELRMRIPANYKNYVFI